MKKSLSKLFLFTCIILVLSIASSFSTFAAVTAIPTSSDVYVDGQKVSFEAYNINGTNYFKLRDLAFALNSTSKLFSIGYDSNLDAVQITTGQPYDPIGGEMSKGNGENKTPSLTSSLFFKDGEQFYPLSYRIDGSNYYKLRDIAAILDLGIGWNSEENAITISTNEKYVMPEAAGEELSFNNYYLLSLGENIETLNQRFGTGVLNKDYGIVEYPQGFYVATNVTAGEDIPLDQRVTSINGNTSLLFYNCPETISYTQIKKIFGRSIIIYSDYDDSYNVSVPYAGYFLTFDSDNDGNVYKSGRFNFNPTIKYSNDDFEEIYYQNYNEYIGKWSYGSVGEFSFENKYIELNIVSVDEFSLLFDIKNIVSIFAEANNIIATSLDGIHYTATFEDSWNNTCSITIILQDGKVFINTFGMVYDYTGDLSRI